MSCLCYYSLNTAIRNNHPDCLRNLISRGITMESPYDLSEKNGWGATPLQLASQEGHSECVLVLLEYGADVNGKGNDGSVPLHEASYNGHNDCIIALLKHEANINAKDNNGDTPLHVASQYSHTESVITLLKNGADPLVKNSMGMTSLDVAAEEISKIIQEYLDFPEIKEPKDNFTYNKDYI